MERKIYTYATVIGIDGMGNFDTKANTPNIDALIENGSCNHFALSEDPTISAENWAAMLFGTSPQVHGKTNNYISVFEHTDKNMPSLLSRVRTAFPDAYLVSAVNWKPINHGIIEHDINAELVSVKDDGKLTDEIVKRIADKPKLLFVQFDEVDGAGHRNTYGSPEYIGQIETTDTYVGRITEAYKKAGIYEDTLFIVIADHGGIRKGHGGYSDSEKYVTFAVSGEGVLKGKMGEANTRDVSAVVLYALGIEVPEYDKLGFSSRVPGGVFEGEQGYTRPETKEYRVESAATPDFNGENGLKSIFDDRIQLAMFFDNSLIDETGNRTFKMENTVKYYSDGVMGSRGEFGMTGYAETKDLKIGKGSFSVSAWVRLDKKTLTEDCCVCGNLDRSGKHGRKNGFAFIVKNYDTAFTLSTPESGFTLVTPYPEDFKDGWLNIIHVIDKESRQIKVYMNFRFVRSFDIPDDLKWNFNAHRFAVGNDVSGCANTEIFPNTFNMDDLIIFNDALTDGDVRKLKNYYGF